MKTAGVFHRFSHDDLQSLPVLKNYHRSLVLNLLWPDGESGLLRLVTLALHCTRVARNPPAMFMRDIRARRMFGSAEDEDRARALIAREHGSLREGGLQEELRKVARSMRASDPPPTWRRPTEEQWAQLQQLGLKYGDRSLLDAVAERSHYRGSYRNRDTVAANPPTIAESAEVGPHTPPTPPRAPGANTEAERQPSDL